MPRAQTWSDANATRSMLALQPSATWSAGTRLKQA